MKIKSRFKDYYDYVAHAYGGGDERVTYVREPLPDTLTSVTLPDFVDLPTPGLSGTKAYTKHLIVNSRVYTLIAVVDPATNLPGPYQLFHRDNFDDDDIINLKVQYRWRDNEGWSSLKWERYFGQENATALALSKIIKQPVFLVDSYHRNWTSKSTQFEINPHIPVLREYGINHYIQPEQLYQEIAYFMSNKMVDSPDLVVHNNMTDKEKILQHGFDIKQSFRHRK
jgi:hypothetical protein